MILLLDTHSFLWALFEPRRLSPVARRAIADTSNDILVSPVSLWEIAVKFSLGKLQLMGCEPEDLVTAAEEMGLGFASPAPVEFAGSHRLPRDLHRDPFDRMLVWQCLCNGWTLLSRDRALPAYRRLGLKTCW